MDAARQAGFGLPEQIRVGDFAPSPPLASATYSCFRQNAEV